MRYYRCVIDISINDFIDEEQLCSDLYDFITDNEQTYFGNKTITVCEEFGGEQ